MRQAEQFYEVIEALRHRRYVPQKIRGRVQIRSVGYGDEGALHPKGLRLSEDECDAIALLVVLVKSNATDLQTALDTAPSPSPAETEEV